MSRHLRQNACMVGAIGSVALFLLTVLITYDFVGIAWRGARGGLEQGSTLGLLSIAFGGAGVLAGGCWCVLAHRPRRPSSPLVLAPPLVSTLLAAAAVWVGTREVFHTLDGVHFDRAQEFSARLLSLNGYVVSAAFLWAASSWIVLCFLGRQRAASVAEKTHPKERLWWAWLGTGVVGANLALTLFVWLDPTPAGTLLGGYGVVAFIAMLLLILLPILGRQTAKDLRSLDPAKAEQIQWTRGLVAAALSGGIFCLVATARLFPSAESLAALDQTGPEQRASYLARGLRYVFAQHTARPVLTVVFVTALVLAVLLVVRGRSKGRAWAWMLAAPMLAICGTFLAGHIATGIVTENLGPPCTRNCSILDTVAAVARLEAPLNSSGDQLHGEDVTLPSVDATLHCTALERQEGFYRGERTLVSMWIEVSPTEIRFNSLALARVDDLQGGETIAPLLEALTSHVGRIRSFGEDLTLDPIFPVVFADRDAPPELVARVARTVNAAGFRSMRRAVVRRDDEDLEHICAQQESVEGSR